MAASPPDTKGTVLGIIAGGGQLPIAIADAATSEGRRVFVLALEGMASPTIARFPHAWVGLGEVGKIVKLLRETGCTELTLAGAVARPNFHQLKLDTAGALALPKILLAAVKGDDALLRAIVEHFEKEGFAVVGSADAARELLAPSGKLGKHGPGKSDRGDIAHGLDVVDRLGALDVGQAAVVCEGLVLAVEAVEGTDAMLMRVAGLPEEVRGTARRRRGVLIKAPKPHQDRRVDLPVIGPQTVQLAANAGLAGIAILAGAVLVVNRSSVVEEADREGIFVFGFTRDDVP